MLQSVIRLFFNSRYNKSKITSILCEKKKYIYLFVFRSFLFYAHSYCGECKSGSLQNWVWHFTDAQLDLASLAGPQRKHHRARLPEVQTFISGVWWWLTCLCVCLCASRWPVTLWPCTLDRSRRAMSVSVSQIGIDRSLDRSIDQSRFPGQSFDQSIYVCRCLYKTATLAQRALTFTV